MPHQHQRAKKSDFECGLRALRTRANFEMAGVGLFRISTKFGVSSGLES
jgi:hypothetical protein